ncbi:MAG: DUF6447 family protein [Methylococcales bacterium]|nr:DUF6447 family protein [Methylococcales bacterium]
MAEAPAKVNIDGKDYLFSDLSDDAKAQIQSLQFVETEIARLNAKLAITNTAKLAYQNALKDLLPE